MGPGMEGLDPTGLIIKTAWFVHPASACPDAIRISMVRRSDLVSVVRSRFRREVRRRFGFGGGLGFRTLRTVRLMTAPLSASLGDAERDLQTAQSESDPQRQGQYARSAADTAAEVAVDNSTSSADCERAVSLMKTALALAAQSLLRDAQANLAEAGGHNDPQRRRELARTAISKARQVMRYRDASDEERAEARRVIGHGRVLASAVSASVRRQQRVEPEREREQPGLAI